MRRVTSDVVKGDKRAVTYRAAPIYKKSHDNKEMRTIVRMTITGMTK